VKLFITGISGLLGLNFALQARNRFAVSGAHNLHPVSVPEVESTQLDITSLQAVEALLAAAHPDVMVHTAALTNVEQCESDPALAQQINQVSAQHVARSASALGARLVHISTDHLFDGTRQWTSESDPPSPMNTYAKTKYQGELSVLEACPDALIIRTNFFGWGTPVRTSFSDWILNSLENREQLNMFSDGYFTPILINDLVELIIRLIDIEASGIINVGGSDRVSKYEFALELARTFDYPTDRITPVSMDSFGFNAARPKDMSFRSEKIESILATKMPALADSLARLKSLQSKGWPQMLESAISGPVFIPNVTNSPS
jgi:dTDP-4-dehydrorhamnose reductase